MPNKVKEEYKDRQYYMDAYHRVKSKLKSALEEIQVLKGKRPSEEENIIIQDLRAKNRKLQIKIQSLAVKEKAISARKKIKKLQQENEKLKFQIERLKKNINYSDVDMQKLRMENDIQKEALSNLVVRNKRIFGKYYDRLSKEEKGFRLKLDSIILDYELLHIFQRYFEMHVFDYIVDRQEPENKTEEDTIILIKTCQTWAKKQIEKLIYAIGVNPVEFKKEYLDFAMQYIEEIE